jgi:hypothetical protein
VRSPIDKRNRKSRLHVADQQKGTTKTTTFECVISGKQFVFFDTPGFDDTYRGDADILIDIAQALSSSYRNQMKLTGIIYLHRIKDERMTNALMRNLTMFRSLCGDDAFKNVVLVTTFWDELPDLAKGEAREKMLVEVADWWGYMASKGSQVRRFLNTRESALDVLADLTGLPEITLQIQEEMVNQGLEVGETTAGEALNQELADLTAKFARELEVLQEEKEQARKEHDIHLQELLEKMETEKQDLLMRLESEQAALHADRREQERRMEQFFNDQLLRLQREGKAREQKIEELESRLSDERADSERRFQEAMAESNRVLQDLKAGMAAQEETSRARYEEAMRVVREKQDEAARAKAEVDRLNKEVEEVIVGQGTADWTERRALEQRLAYLESQREQSQTNFWDILRPIATIGTSVLIRSLFS